MPQLGQDARTPEDKAVLDAWQKEIDQERRATERNLRLGAGPPELVLLPDGIATLKQEVEDSRERGEEPGGPYNSGRRA